MKEETIRRLSEDIAFAVLSEYYNPHTDGDRFLKAEEKVCNILDKELSQVEMIPDQDLDLIAAKWAGKCIYPSQKEQVVTAIRQALNEGSLELHARLKNLKAYNDTNKTTIKRAAIERDALLAKIRELESSH